MRCGEGAVGEGLAAAEADPDHDRPRRGHRLRVGVAAGDGLGVQGLVELVYPLLDQSIDASSSPLACLAARRSAASSSSNSSKASTTVARATGSSRRRLADLGIPRSPAPAPGRRRGAEGLDHEHLLALAVADQVAAVGDAPAGRRNRTG